MINEHGRTLRTRRTLTALNAMGSAEAIAQFIASHGIKGERGVGGRCPVAYLLRFDSKTTNTVAVRYTCGAPNHNGIVSGYIINHGSCLIEFIQAFDSGCYPALIGGQS